MDKEMSVEFATDEDGFFSQECPACKEMFKVKYGQGSEKPVSFCPYCKHAGQQCWWTEEQAKYIQNVITRQVMEPMMEDFSKDISRHSSGFLKITSKVTPSPVIPIPKEQNIPMQITLFECCDETVKLSLEAKLSNCVICGIEKPLTT